MRRSIIALGCVAVLAGCGTIMNESWQNVRVETPGVLGASCTLETPMSKQVALTPMTINIERSRHDLHVVCEKAHYHPAIMKVESHLTWASSALNAVNGFIPGMAVDAASHSVYAYPDVIRVEMTPDEEAIAAGQQAVADPAAEPLKKRVREMPEMESAPSKADESFTKTLNK